MPPEITHPGVFIEEIHSPAHPIKWVNTSITAFLGFAKRGPLHKPKHIQSFAEYERTFGVPAANSEMGYAVQQFFNNGGQDAYVLRVKKAGASGLQVQPQDIAALDTIRDLNLLCLPGVSDSGTLATADSYCKSRRMFLIIDAPRSAKLPADIATFVSSPALPKTSSAAIYYPWINILAGGQPRLSAPSGTIAGLYARIDNNRGVWKAPAGTEATLTGAQSLDHALTDTENDTLNTLGVSCLRAFPNTGVLAWGARTLAADQQNSEYKYIPVRRMALFLEESIFRGTQWAVFEPNDEPLWAQLRLSVNKFLNRLFRQGAFQGITQAQAYFVKCDRDTMTQSDIDAGLLNILVGFAPLKPAEFVILRIQQKKRSITLDK